MRTHSGLVLVLTLAFVPKLSVAQVSLKGIIDVHVHWIPSSAARSYSDVPELARMLHQEGMRGLVLKDNHASSVQLAFESNQAVPEVTIFGGIVLNRAVGGINPKAVEEFANYKGGYGRMVWMPTRDAENQARLYSRRTGQMGPFGPVSRDGALLPEVREVLKIIASKNLALASGHLGWDEVSLLIREARRAGVKQIVITHAITGPVRLTVEQMKEAAGMGAYLEFVYNLIYPDPEMPQNSRLTFTDYASAIHAIGPEHCIISTDVGMSHDGKSTRPLPTVAMKEYLTGLLKAGVTEREIDVMARRNPARLLGLK